MNLKLIQSEFEINFLRSEFKIGCEVFNLVQYLVFSCLENNPVMLSLKRTTKEKISHFSVSTFDIDEVGSMEHGGNICMEETGKSLSFSKVS